MATQQTSSSRSVKAIAGAVLLALGMVLLFANLDAVAGNLGRPVASPADSPGSVIELGLAGLRATQAYFFDHPRFQADLHQILISFWPLLLVIFGGALLQNAANRRLANSRMALRTPPGAR